MPYTNNLIIIYVKSLLQCDDSLDLMWTPSFCLIDAILSGELLFLILDLCLVRMVTIKHMMMILIIMVDLLVSSLMIVL